MNLQGLKFRYINYACYEIVLPNGKVIVIDPCILMPNVKDPSIWFKKEDFTGADYILLSHTHLDHTMEVGYLADKFTSKVIVPALSSFSLTESIDLITDQVYPVFPNEKFIFEDFKLEVYRGKHTFSRKGGRMSERISHPINPNGNAAEKLTNLYGSMEYCDYMITTKENVRIFICGGQPQWFYFTNADEIVKEKAPNIIIRQSSSKYTPEEYGRHMASYGAQLILPLHQDGLSRSPIDCTPEYWFERANKELEKIGAVTRILNPIPFQWYVVSMSIIKE